MKRTNILVTSLRLFFQAKRAQRSFLSEGFHVFFLENIFMGGRDFGGSEPLPEYFRCDSIPSLAYRQMHSFLGSICLTASECFPIFIYSFGLANLAERPVCDSTCALREFSFSGRINYLKPGSDGVPRMLRDSDDLVLSSHFSFDYQILLVSLDSS